jgi:hypothetical protein
MADRGGPARTLADGGGHLAQCEVLPVARW